MTISIERLTKRSFLAKFFIVPAVAFFILSAGRDVFAANGKNNAQKSPSESELVTPFKNIGVGSWMIVKGAGQSVWLTAKGMYNVLDFTAGELLMPVKPLTQWLTGRFGVSVEGQP